ncbi:hypothetical protein G3578_09125 [Brevibacillus sp. SYP-B805]|nr:hypothetical protein [Brevibacillus sp. SYP-B805]
MERLQKRNEAAVNRLKEELTPEQAEQVERAFFEDDEEIRLRDGKTYKVPPCSLKDARILMKKLRTINVDAIILNFVPSGDDAVDASREDDLFTVLMMAFKGYKHITREYLDEYMDLDTARKTIEILIGLNGLKK